VSACTDCGAAVGDASAAGGVLLCPSCEAAREADDGMLRLCCVYCDCELKVPPVEQRTKVRCPACSEAFFLSPDGGVAARLEGNSTAILQQPGRFEPLTPAAGVPEGDPTRAIRADRIPSPEPAEPDPRESTRKISRELLRVRAEEREAGGDQPEPALAAGPLTAPVLPEVVGARTPVGLKVWAALLAPLVLAALPLEHLPRLGELDRLGRVVEAGLRQANHALPPGWRLPVLPPPVRLRDATPAESDLRRTDEDGK